ncbi:DegT/DnrJ/EryC1/StrS family aminotransferase [Niabella beijingensis]|uniref:DegT/DnrJ/EryC1/StrS family aminotransferase n=1 Tax=Niabella beijingensis TaxID=2872700 RepID=UPI001CC10FF9|nr:DegT/DnrJ/EryC1/StrS family aminotransferase [Niabella beijingensis]MBZ4189996.1 DegT/DnrJ/EryC1/StrS family aminotransferase [Niabella beijingensis]
MIKFLDLQKINLVRQEEIEQRLLDTFRSGWYLQGKELRTFESALAAYIGVDHAIGVASGLDALRLILRGYIELGVIHEGDEIIVPANTYIASILAITDNRLKPVLVEPESATYNIDFEKIEMAVSARTKAIMVVHLYGRCAWSEKLVQLADKYDLKIIEDSAQAIGACWCNRRTGGLGDAAGFSFYPGKNLGALGDGGAVLTNDLQLKEIVSSLANYGASEKYIHRFKGINSRLSELQATVLNVKLKYLDEENAQRREIAHRYSAGIENTSILLPEEPADSLEHVWHLFVIRSAARYKLQDHLRDHHIQTLIHYPVPPHKQEAYQEWNDLHLPLSEQIHQQVLSLPISPVMTTEETEKVIAAVNSFRAVQ